jgi:L-ascorbate metabolism protein UlaG (beta-lactamase superfamily)
MRGLAMRFLGHSTVRLELAGSVVLTDRRSPRRVGCRVMSSCGRTIAGSPPQVGAL